MLAFVRGALLAVVLGLSFSLIASVTAEDDIPTLDKAPAGRVSAWREKNADPVAPKAGQASATGEKTAADKVAPKAEQASAAGREKTGADAVDCSRFPLLTGKISTADGIFDSFVPPSAGEAVTLNLANPKDAKLVFKEGYISAAAPFQVQEVFWEAKTGNFRGMRLVSENSERRGLSRLTIDLHCYYRPGDPFFKERTMNAFLVQEVGGQVLSVATFNLEFEGELPKRR